MNKVLILVVSCQSPPYGEMIDTSLNTWDSINVEGVETVFYCGQPVNKDTNKIIYFDIQESYANMGRKLLAAFQWALINKEFDYIARVNSSCYVNKKELLKYVQILPSTMVFSGLRVIATHGHKEWVWGGGQFLISKDVIKMIVEKKSEWDHTSMEDISISTLVSKICIPYMSGLACSIDKLENGWRCLCYGTESFLFTDFSDIKKSEGQFFYRVKQDYDRQQDKYVMNELFKYLK